MITLEKTTSKDLPVLLEIEKTVIGPKVYSGYSSEKEIQEWIDNDVIYFIKKDDTVVGSISYEIKNENHVYISGLVIRPEYQRQGMASRAIRLLLAELREFKKFSLVVHPDNPAFKVYEAFGFKTESRVENYFGDGEPRLVMIKNQN